MAYKLNKTDGVDVPGATIQGRDEKEGTKKASKIIQERQGPVGAAYEGQGGNYSPVQAQLQEAAKKKSPTQVQ